MHYGDAESATLYRPGNIVSTPRLSIVIPVYMAERVLPEMVRLVASEAEKIVLSFEIVLVDDGSTDGSWRAIEKEAQVRPYVKGIKLSRNFCDHHAVNAGVAKAKREFCVVMESGLQ